MFGDFDKYIGVFLTALLVTYVLTPGVRALANKFGVVDKPDPRRPHKRTTARGGGIAVVIAVFAASMLAIANSWSQMGSDWWTCYFLGASILAVVGIIDDVRGMRPLVKLAGQSIAAFIMTSSGARFGSVFGIELPPLLDHAMVIFYVVAVINAFNLIDGLDGLASGLAIISATGLCIIFIIGQTPGSILVLVALIGASLGFLRYNFHPATIFLGDTGSMFLGFTLGVVSLQTFHKNAFLLSLTIPILVLGVPIYDSLLAVWRRSVRMWLPTTNPDGTEKKRGIMTPDVEHLHHRLLKMGLSTRRVATSLFILNGGLVILGILLATFDSHRTGIVLFALLIAAYVLMRHLAVLELHETGKVILTGLRRPTQSSLQALSYPVWDMVWLTGAVAFVMRALESVQVNFWHTWFLELPIWVTPTFSLLATSRTYVTLWTRARVLDVLILAGTLQIGLAISLGLALLIDPAESHRWLIRALVLGALSHPAIIASRVFYRSVEELVSYFRTPGASTATGRLLLYGGGVRCQLYIKERVFTTSGMNDGNLIVGLIDDERLLRNQWIHGYKVLGAAEDIPSLIAKHRITRVLVTAKLSPESRARLEEMARKHHFDVSEWRYSETPLVIS